MFGQLCVCVYICFHIVNSSFLVINSSLHKQSHWIQQVYQCKKLLTNGNKRIHIVAQNEVLIRYRKKKITLLGNFLLLAVLTLHIFYIS